MPEELCADAFAPQTGHGEQQNKHYTKAQLGQSMSLLHFFAEYGQGVTYKSVGDPKTAASLPSPTHSQMTTSSKLHHGVSLPLNLALPIYSSTSLAVGGKQEEAVAGIPIASLPVPQT